MSTTTADIARQQARRAAGWPKLRAPDGGPVKLPPTWGQLRNLPAIGKTRKSPRGKAQADALMAVFGLKPAKDRHGFAARCIAAGLPQPVAEHRFHPTRKWRFDWCWPEHRLAVEVDGGLFSNGGHTRGKAREGDYEKDFEAAIAGWHVLRVSTGQVRDGRAVGWLTRLFEKRNIQYKETL